MRRPCACGAMAFRSLERSRPEVGYVRAPMRPLRQNGGVRESSNTRRRHACWSDTHPPWAGTQRVPTFRLNAARFLPLALGRNVFLQRVAHRPDHMPQPPQHVFEFGTTLILFLGAATTRRNTEGVNQSTPFPRPNTEYGPHGATRTVVEQRALHRAQPPMCRSRRPTLWRRACSLGAACSLRFCSPSPSLAVLSSLALSPALWTCLWWALA